MTLPNGGLISRALRRAIALVKGALAGLSCREMLKGEKPSELRAEMKEYEELLGKIEPGQKGAKGAEA